MFCFLVWSNPMRFSKSIKLFAFVKPNRKTAKTRRKKRKRRRLLIKTNNMGHKTTTFGVTIIKPIPNIFWNKRSKIEHVRNRRYHPAAILSMKHLHPARPPVIRPNLLQVQMIPHPPFKMDGLFIFFR